MRLVVAEKPSVARDLAAALGASRKGEGVIEGEDLVVSWCVGHLLELEEPVAYDPRYKRWSLESLPILPRPFQFRPRKEGRDQLRVLERLLRDRRFREVVNACDAGREGEHIFRMLLTWTGCKARVLRFWTSSLTPEAIREAWRRLRPSSDFDALARAARCRSEADWLVGMNATRALTVRGGELLTVGRVQTPTLALIAARDDAIAAFVPTTFFQLRVGLTSGPGPFGATWSAAPERTAEPRPDDEVAPESERIGTRPLADSMAEAVAGRPGRVVEVTRTARREPPPQLDDLTSLQRRANGRYGMTASRVLDVAQALYERHKLITYPRTDARVIGPAEAATLPAILRGLAAMPVYKGAAEALLAAPLALGRRIVDPAEIGDHHAILPTGRTPDAARLSPDEKRIFDLVARRLLGALSPEAVFDLCRVVVEIDAENPPLPPRFVAVGRVCRVAGWRAVDPPQRVGRDVDLPPVERGMPVDVRTTGVVEGSTRPPRPMNDASVLQAMETAGRELDDAELRRAMRGAGLGTPATRAGILATLVERTYVERRGRHLHVTATGRRLLSAVPLPELARADLTAAWEHRLFRMAEGDGAAEPFMADVELAVHRLVDAVRAAPAVAPPVALDAEVLGVCPACGGSVVLNRWAYSCTGAGCSFRVGRRLARREVSPRLMGVLLGRGTTQVVKGWKSKEGKPFAAALAWDANERRVRFRFEGDAPSSSSEAPRRKAPTPPASPALVLGQACPTCGEGVVIAGRVAWGCSRWREGCGFRTAPVGPA